MPERVMLIDLRQPDQGVEGVTQVVRLCNEEDESKANRLGQCSGLGGAMRHGSSADCAIEARAEVHVRCVVSRNEGTPRVVTKE